MELNLTLLLEQFFNSTVQISFPWLIVMAAVIILDLIVGLKKAVYVGEEVRLSRAVRRTLTKTIGYFWLVFTFGFIDTATKFDLSFTTWGCLIVCAIELSSTASNFLATTFFLAILLDAIVSAIVSASGKPSGIADTAKATTDKNIS